MKAKLNKIIQTIGLFTILLLISCGTGKELSDFQRNSSKDAAAILEHKKFPPVSKSGAVKLAKKSAATQKKVKKEIVATKKKATLLNTDSIAHAELDSLHQLLDEYEAVYINPKQKALIQYLTHPTPDTINLASVKFRMFPMSKKEFKYNVEEGDELIFRFSAENFYSRSKAKSKKRKKKAAQSKLAHTEKEIEKLAETKLESVEKEKHIIGLKIDQLANDKLDLLAKFNKGKLEMTHNIVKAKVVEMEKIAKKQIEKADPLATDKLNNLANQDAEKINELYKKTKLTLDELIKADKEKVKVLDEMPSIKLEQVDKLSATQLAETDKITKTLLAETDKIIMSKVAFVDSLSKIKLPNLSPKKKNEVEELMKVAKLRLAELTQDGSNQLIELDALGKMEQKEMAKAMKAQLAEIKKLEGFTPRELAVAELDALVKRKEKTDKRTITGLTVSMEEGAVYGQVNPHKITDKSIPAKESGNMVFKFTNTIKPPRVVHFSMLKAPKLPVFLKKTLTDTTFVTKNEVKVISQDTIGEFYMDNVIKVDEKLNISGNPDITIRLDIPFTDSTLYWAYWIGIDDKSQKSYAQFESVMPSHLNLSGGADPLNAFGKGYINRLPSAADKNVQFALTDSTNAILFKRGIAYKNYPLTRTPNSAGNYGKVTDTKLKKPLYFSARNLSSADNHNIILKIVVFNLDKVMGDKEVEEPTVHQLIEIRMKSNELVE